MTIAPPDQVVPHAGGMLVSFIQSNHHGFGDGYLAASDHRKDGQAVGF